MKILTDFTSPNWNRRPSGSVIDTVILHYTGMKTGLEALHRLCDPAAEVSAHYLIEEDGRVFQLVAEENRAWHAGISSWQGRENINHTSIGIELVNPGHEFGYQPFPKEQIDSLLELLAGIKARYRIPTARFLGHSDIAPDRKSDPGPLFPWQYLADHGYGIFSAKEAFDQTLIPRNPTETAAFDKLNKQLVIVGYPKKNCATIDGSAAQALAAFQAHWRPAAVTGTFDIGTAVVLNDIAEMILVGDS